MDVEPSPEGPANEEDGVGASVYPEREKAYAIPSVQAALGPPLSNRPINHSRSRRQGRSPQQPPLLQVLMGAK